jgi:hypothetical protein
VGKVESAADSDENGLFVSNNATFGLVLIQLEQLEQGGQNYRIKKYLSFGPSLDGQVIPDASAARMTGVIVASVRRIRFRP